MHRTTRAVLAVAICIAAAVAVSVIALMGMQSSSTSTPAPEPSVAPVTGTPTAGPLTDPECPAAQEGMGPAPTSQSMGERMPFRARDLEVVALKLGTFHGEQAAQASTPDRVCTMVQGRVYRLRGGRVRLDAVDASKPDAQGRRYVRFSYVTQDAPTS